MASKYSIGPRKRWEHRTGVRLTDHAVDRWDERTPPSSVAPETAFENGLRLTDPAVRVWFSHRKQPLEEARLWRCDDGTVPIMPVIETDERLVPTVLTMDGEDDPARRAWLNVRAQELRGDLDA